MAEQDFQIEGTFRFTVRKATESETSNGPVDQAAGQPRGALESGPRPPVSAVVKFGDPNLRSPFPSPRDTEAPTPPTPLMVPDRTIIRQGGSVTFQVAPFLQLAIYEPGIQLKDIRIQKETLRPVSFGPFSISNFQVDDPDGRIQLSPPPTQHGYVWTTPAGTFDRPGQYLTVSASVPFLSFARMHGWVEVK